MNKLGSHFSRYYYLLLIVPFLIFVRGISGFPYPSQDAIYSDLAITHFPNAVFLKNQILTFGKIPLWSPLIFSGYPFAANPLSGLWYPPGWLALLFPLPLGLNLLAGLHLVLGAVGLKTLLSSEGLSERAALFGALVFAFTPKLFAHYGAGHLTLIYAIPWTPWLLWSARQSRLYGGRWHLLPSILMSLICLADPRWIIFAGLLWVGYAFAHRRITTNEYYLNRIEENANIEFGLINKLKFLFILLSQAILSILLSCPLLIPLYEYTSLSTRSSLTKVNSLEFSLSPGKIFGLVFPAFGGNHEFMVYMGGTIFVLFFISLFRKSKLLSEKFWLCAALFSYLFALGSNFPLTPFLVNLPGFNLLRVPTRAIFITSISLGAVGAYTIEDILNGENFRTRRTLNLLLTALVALTVFMAAGVWFISGEFPEPFVFGSGIVLVVYFLFRVRFLGILPANTWYPVLLLLTMFDLGVVDLSVLTYKSRDEVLSKANHVLDYIHKQNGLFRVYSPSYSLPQSVAAINGIQLADGVDPLYLSTYSEYMREATGVPVLGYGVTIPPFDGGPPEIANAAFIPDPWLLGQLNVRFVISEFPLSVEGLEFRDGLDSTYVYENLLSLPRAWVIPENSTDNADYESVIVDYNFPNQIEVNAKGPGNLILSEIYYPGWKASVDDSNIGIESYNRIFMSVILGPGLHRITYSFFPKSIKLGLLMFACGLFSILLFCYIFHKKRKVR